MPAAACDRAFSRHGCRRRGPAASHGVRAGASRRAGCGQGVGEPPVTANDSPGGAAAADSYASSMRIVVSGTHASGKSTLIGDLSVAHPAFDVLPDPYELIDAASDEPDAGTFLAQLGISARRLHELPPGARVIAERGPLDFLAYLDALEALGRPTRTGGYRARAAEATAEAMARVDLLVLLPLTESDRILVPDDEDPELREAMNEALLELADDPDLVGDAEVLEVVGDPASRVAQVQAAMARFASTP